MSTRVGIADDQEVVRAGFRIMLERADDMTVVGEDSTGDQAVHLARRERPDVLLMDVRMPGLDGIEATRRITEDPALASVHVLVITTFEIEDYVFDALRAGASGFLLKNLDADELRRAVRVIAGGQALLAPAPTRQLIGRFLQTRAVDRAAVARLARLTDREREVVALAAEGRSNDEIAADLVISPATARTHIARAMLKLEARDRAQLVIAYQGGALGHVARRPEDGTRRVLPR
ncbi:MAG: response regulator transcription factor [Acidobacteria bacterium]|nr:response regulator transcription factor [Acidobacteriota bacterium]